MTTKRNNSRYDRPSDDYRLGKARHKISRKASGWYQWRLIEVIGGAEIPGYGGLEKRKTLAEDTGRTAAAEYNATIRGIAGNDNYRATKAECHPKCAAHSKF